jgi:hypothetical protein
MMRFIILHVRDIVEFYFYIIELPGRTKASSVMPYNDSLELNNEKKRTF